jgi:hypothetical protein
MSMKKLILTGLSLFIIGAAQAQDRGNQEYKDGMDDGADVSAVLHSTGCIAGRNVIAVAPFQFSENGVGFGLSYEHTMDEQGYISFYLPAIATFNLGQDNYHSSYYGSNRNNVMFYAMPGVKFYPTRMGKVKYAIGPSFVVGVGQKDDYYRVYDPYLTSTYYAYNSDRFLLGMMLNNSLNINPTPHLYVGAEFGFGFTYFDRIGGYNRGITGLVQGSFKVGYRF